MKTKNDGNSQLCIYVGEEKVVDIYSVYEDEKNEGIQFDGDTCSIWYSSGKSVGNILMGLMRQQGLVDYDRPVKDYWPEFAQNGKDNITISDVCRHESGLHKLHKQYQA